MLSTSILQKIRFNDSRTFELIFVIKLLSSLEIANFGQFMELLFLPLVQ